MSIILQDHVAVDRVNSGYLSDFIDAYGLDVEASQDSYFTLWASDFEEYYAEYPDHEEELKMFYEELMNSGATKAVVLFWW